jgi:GNAT superfamily N-acetyltransferase
LQKLIAAWFFKWINCVDLFLEIKGIYRLDLLYIKHFLCNYFFKTKFMIKQTTSINTPQFIYREATIEDIPQIQMVRNAVKENMLSNPNLVTDADCVEFMTVRGKGWVCVIENNVVGFSIVDLKENNIWALFVRPNFDKRGIGRQLHDVMLDWYFKKTDQPVWLGTAPGTRAEKFYRTAGWKEIGMHGTKEIKFEMSFEDWKKRL